MNFPLKKDPDKNAKNRGTHDPPRPGQTCRKGPGRSLALWEMLHGNIGILHGNIDLPSGKST